MIIRLKDLSLRAYIRHVRKQNKHIQHVHAVAFAGIISALIAGVILYTDYGFWHEQYRAADATIQTQESFETESLGESVGRFFNEAKRQFGSIGSSSMELLEGKEVYKRSE